jgi:hypothetical protein
LIADAPSPLRSRRIGWRAVLCLLLAFAMPAAQSQAPRVVQVEAAFLVNFVRYTDWPRERFADATTPYRIAVVGNSETADTVRAVAEAAGMVKGRRIEVQQVPPPRDSAQLDLERLRACHLVFVRNADAQTHDAILRGLAGQPVLTVGDDRNFAVRGGMLGIVRADARLAIEANPRAIEAGGLLVSAKVLKLARIRRGSVR